MPRLYGTEHTTYVIISVLVTILVCVLSKLFIKTEKQQGIVMRCAGAILFAVILINRLALVYEHDTVNWMKLITDSICSTTSYVLGFSLLFLKRNNPILHF